MIIKVVEDDLTQRWTSRYLSNKDDSVQVLSSDEYNRVKINHLDYKIEEQFAKITAELNYNIVAGKVGSLESKKSDSTYYARIKAYGKEKDSLVLATQKGVAKNDTAGYLHIHTFNTGTSKSKSTTLLDKGLKIKSQIFNWGK